MVTWSALEPRDPKVCSEEGWACDTGKVETSARRGLFDDMANDKVALSCKRARLGNGEEQDAISLKLFKKFGRVKGVQGTTLGSVFFFFWLGKK